MTDFSADSLKRGSARWDGAAAKWYARRDFRDRAIERYNRKHGLTPSSVFSESGVVRLACSRVGQLRATPYGTYSHSFFSASMYWSAKSRIASGLIGVTLSEKPDLILAVRL
jgi:hypothetical protein